jgi:hypothetical protein
VLTFLECCISECISLDGRCEGYLWGAGKGGFR